MECWVSSVKCRVYKVTQDHIVICHNPDEFWQEAVQVCTAHRSLTVHCALCTLHCALCIVQCELFTVNCAMWTVECELCTVDCAQSTVGRPIVDCALLSEHHALCIGAWILCTVHWVANTMQFFLYSVQQALDSWTFSFYTMGNRP